MGAVGLLVAWGILFTRQSYSSFRLAILTLTELDAAFSPLIMTSCLFCVKVAIATTSALIAFLKESLSSKSIRKVRQLHHLWDFDKLMQKHMHILGGFA